MIQNADRARRLFLALRNTRTPPKNPDADRYRALQELALLMRLHGKEAPDGGQ